RPNQAYLYIVRSPVAHAQIGSIDVVQARAARGVLAVFTAADLAAGGVEPMQCAWPLYNKDGSPMADVPREVLAGERLRYVGQPVVAIVAESVAQAKDAAELVAIDYDDLHCVMDMRDAIAPQAQTIFDHVPRNLCLDWEMGDRAATDAAFAAAAHVVSVEHVQNRVVPSAIEPRAAIGEYDPGKDEYTLYVCSQNPHLARSAYCRETLHIAETKLRVIAPDVGGGFGSKSCPYSEDVIALWGSKTVGRPIKWVSERGEAFVSDAHARDHITHVQGAFDDDGRFLAIRVTTLANLGIGTSLFGPVVPTIFYGTMLVGVYRIPTMYASVKCVLTNTSPTDAYRGAGRPEATYTIERLVEAAALELGIDSLELRRRNFIPPEAFPYESAAGLLYDSGEYAKCMDTALQAADYSGFDKRREASAQRGRLRGIGVCVYTEIAGAGPTAVAVSFGSTLPLYEVSTVRVHPDATVSVLTGAHNHGQGHETTFAQIVAERLQVPFENIEVVHGDTGVVPYGVGTFASRSVSLGGSAAVASADKVIEKGKRISAYMLDADDAHDIDYVDGMFRVRGSNNSASFSEVAKMAYLPNKFPTDQLEPGLEETTWYDPPNYTFPCGAHVCEVEVDPQTGSAQILAYTIADEFGVIINPMIVEGQVHGGVAQGIGQALLEQAVYDPDSGQPLAASFLDYGLPRADDLPNFVVEAIEGYTPSNPLGAKGCGEAGAVGAPVTVMNALLDALRPAGVVDLSMPATPLKIWTAIQAARQS
ncbi:MAG: xanthine dehydrogenase family protein molybdopterin-binding subunit, partial [Gammaproteobacteria bacterium]